MAYKDFDGLSLGNANQAEGQTLQVNGSTLELPDASYISNADIQRDGADLVLDGPQGTITVEGYFTALESPVLTAPDGTSLTPDLVNSFAQSPAQYAQSASMNDASPIGAINEAAGEATITRTDGSIEQITIGTPVYQGDIVETSGNGAVNIAFTDDSSFAVSEDARMAIDEYVFDPSTEEGAQNFSVLKGVFVFTSGLVGRDDPDDVNIDTPSGSIGIRGTIIAGDVDNGEITVVEGAIVLRDNNGNEMTLAGQFETGKFGGADDGSISNLGQLSANDVSTKFASVAPVAPALFSSVNDVAGENADAPEAPQAEVAQDGEQQGDAQEDADANGSVDQNNDNEVDGSVEQAGEGENSEGAEGETAGDNAPEGQNQPDNTETRGRGDNNGLGNNNGLGDGANASEGGGEAASNGNGNNGNGNGNANNPPTPPRNTPPERSGEGQQTDPIDPVILRPNGPAPFFEGTTPNVAGNDAGNKRSLGANAFQTADGQDWSYDFSQDFGDNNNDIVSYGITSESLQALQNAGAVVSLAGFPTSGVLDITVGGIASNTLNIDLKIFAVDADGQRADHTYDFDIYKDHGLPSSQLGNDANNDGKVYTFTNDEDLDIGVNAASSSDENRAAENTIFLGDGGDIVRLNNGSKNNIHLGDGDNHVTVENSISSSKDNNVFGGKDTDTFDLKTGGNNLFGMGGDDVFILDIGDGTTRADLLGNNGKTINGGLDGASGDTIKFVDSGFSALDFSNIQDGYFRNIERIDLTGPGLPIDLDNISYQDIVQMTDENNTLIFRGDNDLVDFDNLGAKKIDTLDNVTYKDGAVEFDVYEAEGAQGTITLYIEQSGGSDAITVTGLV